MENNLLKCTQEYDLQTRLNSLKIFNAKIAKCNSGRPSKNSVVYEFTVQDDEILDPIVCQLSDDEERWLFPPASCSASSFSVENSLGNTSKTAGSIWDWLRFTPHDIQLANLYTKCDGYKSAFSSPSMFGALRNPSLSSTIKDQLLTKNLSDQGARKNIVDSRTYTRPKKRSFQTIVGKCFDDTINDENVSRQHNSAQLTSTSNDNTENNMSPSDINSSTTPYFSPLSDSSTKCDSPSNLSFSSSTAMFRSNNNARFSNHTNDTMTSSFGIIDIDQLTNSQLGFNNVLDKEETQTLLARTHQNLHQERSLNPSTGSDKNRQSNWKYKLDDSLINSPTNKPEVLTNVTNSLNDNKLTNQTTNCRSMVGSTCENSKLFNTTTNELLQISFPKEFFGVDAASSDGTDESPANHSTPTTVKKNSTTTAVNNCVNLKDNISMNAKNSDCKEESRVNKETDKKINKSIVNGPSVNRNEANIVNSLSENKNEDTPLVETPPNQVTDLGNPLGYSTPTNNKTELRRKMTYDATTNKAILENGIGASGRLSDSSTDTDVPSISMEDLTEEQVSPISNQFYNTSSNMLSLGQNEKSPLNQTFNASSNMLSLGQTEKSQLNQTYDASSNMLSLGQTEKSQLNQTYNASSNMLSLGQTEKSPLNQTYELMQQTSPANATHNLTLNKSRNGLNNTVNSMLNPSFRRSPINTTFCKSTEALNGIIERADSCPEDDCMSTASDSSFSSSSTHMRSVGEIQSIARLQEESLRQQMPRKKLAWTVNEGLSDTVAELRQSIPKLSSDDGNQSDQSDKSSDRYSPTTLNNNDRGALMNPGTNGKRSPHVYSGLKRFGGSSELYPSTGASTAGNTGSGLQPWGSTGVLTAGSNDQSRKSKMTGLRPPTKFSKPSSQPVATVTSVSNAEEAATAMNSTYSAPQSSISPTMRASGIRPPSVIPRPVSRLPAPKIKSGLPKFNARRN